MALISGFGFVAQFGVLYQAMCMKQLIEETNTLAKIQENSTANGIVDEAIDAQILSSRHGIYLQCFLMVLGQVGIPRDS